jgi:hypothetical protein
MQKRSLLAVEGLYCKRPIQCLASSEILTPHPLPPPASVYPLPLVRGRTYSLGGEGVGVNSSEDARHWSVLYICKYFVLLALVQTSILSLRPLEPSIVIEETHTSVEKELSCCDYLITDCTSKKSGGGEFCELMARILNFRYYLDYSYSFAGTLESMFICYIGDTENSWRCILTVTKLFSAFFALFASVLQLRDVYPGLIQDLVFFVTRIREEEGKFFCSYLFCSHQFHKIENYFIF